MKTQRVEHRVKMLLDMEQKYTPDQRRATAFLLTELYAASALEQSSVEVATHRHKKRGTEYVLIGYGKMQAEWWRKWIGSARDALVTADMSEVAIYRSVDDGTLWVRPREEFEDGRFEPLVGEPT